MALTLESASEGLQLKKTEKISFLIDLWILPIILGVPGNILTAIVATRHQSKRLSPSVYMAAMGVVDTIFLLDRTVALVTNKLLLADQIDTDPLWLFRSQVFIFHTSTILSGLFLAGMSIDRLIAVKFPMDAPRLCTTKRAKTVVITLSFLIVAFNIHIFYMIRYFRDDQLGIYATVMTLPELPQLEVVATGYYVVIGTVLPFTIIFTTNVLIITSLRKASKERKKLESAQNVRLEKDTQYMTRMLIFVSLAYIILSLPFRLFHLLMRIPPLSYDLSVFDSKKYYVVHSWCLGIVWMLNYATNFYLYCIGGGRKYRQEAKTVLKKMFPC